MMPGRMQKGSSLVEVAVSLLVVSIGTLALVSMQLAAKEIGWQALQRTEAAALAEDMMARMRGNPSVLSRYAGRVAGTATSQLPPSVDCRTVNCDPIQLQSRDIWHWRRALSGSYASAGAAGLYRAVGCIAVAGRRVTVDIVWDAPHGKSDAADSDCGSGLYGEGDRRRQLSRLVSYIGLED